MLKNSPTKDYYGNADDPVDPDFPYPHLDPPELNDLPLEKETWDDPPF